MAKRAKSRFMVIITNGTHKTDGSGRIINYYTTPKTINCTSDNTVGAIKETADEIPDGCTFMVVQVKREGLSYGVDSKRVLMGATSHRSSDGPNGFINDGFSRGGSTKENINDSKED